MFWGKFLCFLSPFWVWWNYGLLWEILGNFVNVGKFCKSWKILLFLKVLSTLYELGAFWAVFGHLRTLGGNFKPF